MKINKKTKTPKEESKKLNFADEYGDLYEIFSKQEKTAGGKKLEAATRIKTEAEKKGTTTETANERLLIGENYVVGYMTITPRMVNTDKAKKLLSKEVLKQLYGPRVIDQGKFERAVERGLIDRVTAAKLIISGTPQQRIIVRRQKKNPKS